MERIDLQDLLVRIDERVKAIQKDIREINTARACANHAARIKTLERLTWGSLAGLAGLGLRVAFEMLKN